MARESSSFGSHATAGDANVEMATATDNMETGDEEAEQGEAERVVEEVLEAGEDVECEPCWWKTSGCTFEGKHRAARAQLAY